MLCWSEIRANLMDDRSPDWMWASVAALGLLGIALFAIFVVRLDLGWVYLLMPSVVVVVGDF
jgi:hypothetical protein